MLKHMIYILLTTDYFFIAIHKDGSFETSKI